MVLSFRRVIYGRLLNEFLLLLFLFLQLLFYFLFLFIGLVYYVIFKRLLLIVWWVLSILVWLSGWKSCYLSWESLREMLIPILVFLRRLSESFLWLINSFWPDISKSFHSIFKLLLNTKNEVSSLIKVIHLIFNYFRWLRDMNFLFVFETFSLWFSRYLYLPWHLLLSDVEIVNWLELRIIQDIDISLRVFEGLLIIEKLWSLVRASLTFNIELFTFEFDILHDHISYRVKKLLIKVLFGQLLRFLNWRRVLSFWIGLILLPLDYND